MQGFYIQGAPIFCRGCTSIGHPQDFSPVSGLISLGIPLSVLLPASQPMRSPWTWSSGYEFHAHADLPVLLSIQNLHSVVQVRNTANRGLMLCNAGLVMQKMHWYSHKVTPALHWTPCSSIHSNLHTGTINRTKQQAQETQHATKKLPQCLSTSSHANRSLTGSPGTCTGCWVAQDNAAAPRWSPSFILGAVLSEVTSPR